MSESSADLDRAHVWHPFTQMRDWNAPGVEPVVIVAGEGAVLRAEDGREHTRGAGLHLLELRRERRLLFALVVELVGPS